MTDAPRIACFGELLWDVYPGARRLGGAPANVAFHAQALGATSLLISRVGDDELGHEARAILGESGVDVSEVMLDPERATGTVQVSFEPEGPRYAIQAPVAWDAITLGPSLLERITEQDVFYFGTLAQRAALSQQTLHALLAHARRGPRPPLSIVDLNLRPPFVELETVVASVEQADVVKLNEEELAWLSTALGVDDGLAWLLARPRTRLVALTRGARGAALYRADTSLEHEGFASSGLDPVGAGDAFTASLAVDLARKSALPELLARACQRAAWVASQPGAMPAPG